MFDPTIDFTTEELSIINMAGVTVPALRSFMSVFPELNLDVAITGYKMVVAHAAAQLNIPKVPEMQDPKNGVETKE